MLPGKDDPVVETDPQSPAVEVDLSKKPEVKDEKSAAGEFAEQEASRIRALENLIHGQRRIAEKTQRDLEELKAKLGQYQAPSPQAVQTPSGDELDQLVAQGNWKDAVKKLASKEAEEIVKQREILRQQEEVFKNRNEIMEYSKSVVIGKYPQLDPVNPNEDSSVYSLYNQAMNDLLEVDKQFLSNPYAPKIAMDRMEELAREQGIKLSETPLASNKEIVRREKVRQASLPPGRAGLKSDTVVLSQEEKEFCDFHKIPYENYAKSKRATDKEGAVET